MFTLVVVDDLDDNDRVHGVPVEAAIRFPRHWVMADLEDNPAPISDVDPKLPFTVPLELVAMPWQVTHIVE